MASTFTTNLNLEKPGTGEQAGTWGITANSNYDILDTSINARALKTITATAGTGLTGGGTLAANFTFNVSYGTTAGTATQGDDSRVLNGQTAFGWGNHAVAGYALQTITLTAGTGLTGGGTLAANRTFTVSYGTAAGTATEGNDSRVNNGQTAFGWGNHAAAGYALQTITLTAGTGLTGGGTLAANRTFNVSYGTTAGTATEGNDSRVLNGQTAFGWGNHATAGYATLTGTQTLTNKTLTSPVITENIQVISTGTTAVRSRTYIFTATLTLTLPASPAAGDSVSFANRSGTATPIIARNGQNIMGLAENLTVDNENYFGTLVFADATRGWVFQ